MAILVTILHDSRSEGCQAQCGLDCHSEEDIAFTREHLKRRFGPDIELERLDLSDPSVRERNRDLLKQVQAMSIALPAVAINGVIRLSGNLEFRSIAEAVEVHKEVCHE